MLRAVFALGLLAPGVTVASAIDAKVERMLKQLDPDARFEQVCDLEAMQRIGKDRTYRPERTIVSALANPNVADTICTISFGPKALGDRTICLMTDSVPIDMMRHSYLLRSDFMTRTE